MGGHEVGYVHGMLMPLLQIAIKTRCLQVTSDIVKEVIHACCLRTCGSTVIPAHVQT